MKDKKSQNPLTRRNVVLGGAAAIAVVGTDIDATGGYLTK